MKNGYQKHFEKLQAQKDQGVSIDFKKSRKPTPPASAKKSESPTTAQNLRSRLLHTSMQKQKAKGLPFGLISSSIAGVFIAAAGLAYLPEVERFVKRIEVSFFGYALAEDKVNSATPPVNPAEKQEAALPETKIAKNEIAEEEVNHFSKLNERKRELDAREEELNRLESELATQKIELEKRLAELEKTRRDISSVLEEKVKADDKKVESLVSVYSAMKPQQAAKVFESMDEDLAIEILGRMKKKPAAEILNLVKAEKAQVLSEKYAGYKRK